MEYLLIFAALAALGLFLSATLGLGLYIIALPIVQSIWEVSEINFALMGVLIVGIGAAAGSYLAWTSSIPNSWWLVTILLLTLAASMIGAGIGLYDSRDVFKLVGKPGIPALTGITVGATLGANLFGMAVRAVRTAYRPRI